MKKLFLVLFLLLYMPAISQAQIVKNIDDYWSIDVSDGWYVDKEGNLGENIFVYTINKNSMPIGIMYSSKYDKTILPNTTFTTMDEQERNKIIKEFKESITTTPDVKVHTAEFTKIGSHPALYFKTSYKKPDGKITNTIIVQFLYQSKFYSFMLINTENEKVYEKNFIQMLASFKLLDYKS